MPEERGLSNLGIGQQSQSSNASGGLKDVLGAGDLMDEVGKSRTLETQLTLAQGSEPRSALDFLTSPRGLIAVLGSIGALASGNSTAQNAGLGALLGTLTQAQQVQEGDRSQKAAAIEQLTGQLEKSQGRQDKLRTRMTNIFNTNPEAFQSPTGESPDPEMLGFMLTGQTNLPIWTSTRRNLNMRDKRWEERTAVLTDALENSTTAESARQLTNVLLQQLGDKNPDPATVEALVASYGSTDEESELMKFYMKDFGMSGRDASIFALENKLSFKDPQVLKMLSKPEGTPAEEFTAIELQAFKFVRAWETDPKNAEEVIRIRSGAKDSLEAQRLVNEAALASTDTYGGVDAAALNKRLGVRESTFDELQFQNIFKNVQNRDTYTDAMMEENLLEILGITSEEWEDNQIRTAQQEQADVKANAQRSNAQWAAGQLDFVRSELSKTQVPGADLTWYNRTANDILAAASKKVGVDPGSKDILPPEMREKLRAEIQRQVRIAQAQIEAHLKGQ